MQRRHLCNALLCALAVTACSIAPSTRQPVVEQDAAASAAIAGVVAPPPPPAPRGREAMPVSTLDTVALASPPVAGQANMAMRMLAPAADVAGSGYRQDENTENYLHRDDNPVHRASIDPVSTFSIDVDTGSYANVRRMLREGVRPPADAVRAEEFINYFDYGHPAPSSRALPFRVTTELAPAPWNGKRQLLMIGIKGYDVPKAVLPPANLVFLIDTSGSMDAPNKLPLLKQAFAQLVPQLRAQDRVSIVVYAGSAGLVLPPTPGDRHGEILAALQRLQAGGGTNGGEGIQLAYAMAKQGFARGGVNRVILATDGDFNVGTTDLQALETLVGDQRRSGVALSTLGFGDGNYNDAMAERLADAGDGNHAYIDSLQEARKVLVEEMQSTLLTIARDVKVQVEFNPAQVAEYRLIGYENRALRNEDFANDKVDAGDIGAGHEVTALYEITPVGSGAGQLPPLRYPGNQATAPNAAKSGEIAHLRLRYKLPEGSASKLIETPILRSQLQAHPGESLRFAATVAAFADALRGGTRMQGWDWDDIVAGARDAQGADRRGLRAEFLQLVLAARRQLAADPAGATAIAD